MTDDASLAVAGGPLHEPLASSARALPLVTATHTNASHIVCIRFMRATLVSIPS
ncbi:MAG TPA: hypothetical protein VGH81_11400 [Rudaea sp.]|jgi:hypothetical protein